MSAEPITVSLPKTLTKRLRDAHKKSGVANFSSFIQRTLSLGLLVEERMEEIVDDQIEQLLEVITNPNTD